MPSLCCQLFVIVLKMVSLSQDVKKSAKDYKIVKLLEHYKDSRNVDFSVEFRPSIYKKAASTEWGPNPGRLWPEELWTDIKKVQVPLKISYCTQNISCFLSKLTPKEAHDLKEHHDIQRKRKPPDLFHVSLESSFFIGMDVAKEKAVVTDRNPYLEGLVDIHRCIYLPSAYEKHQILPENMAQVHFFRRYIHYIKL